MPTPPTICAVFCALFFAGSAIAEAPSHLAIAPGVFAITSNRGDGATTVREVRIAPKRRVGEPTPDLTPLLEAAHGWCSGRTPNGFQTQESGHITAHGCRIALDAGVYRIQQTAILRAPSENLQIEIDLGSSVIVHDPDTPSTLTVEELATTACTPKNLGAYYNLENPESFDDFQHSDPEGEVQIELARPNDLRTANCPAGTPTCKYGANALRIRTRTPHGLTDGGALELGDVVVVSAPNSSYDDQRLLVKEVVDATNFIVTLAEPPMEVVKSGVIRETATTVWCNGHRWRAGKPMIAIGGPDSVRKSRLSINGGKFLIDTNLFRTTAILIDGDSGPTGRAGAEWISVNTTHGGNGNLRGQIVVDMGTDDPKKNLCQHISVHVDSNSWGHSWSPSVRNRTCSTSDITVRQGHGGGVWIGIPKPNFNGPVGVSLRGSIHGCYDGPCLWIRSGVIHIADGMKIMGSMWGPQGRGGPAAGVVAILGSDHNSRVNITAHGAIWGAAQDSDLDCYIRMGGMAAFVQVGGQVTSGNSERGFGEEVLFCDTPPNRVDDFVLDHVQRRSWGGRARLVDLSPANLKRTGWRSP
jgi:hypothetical protein